MVRQQNDKSRLSFLFLALVILIGSIGASRIATARQLETARLRVAHLAPFAMDPADTAVTVTLNGEEALTDFRYGESTAYIELEAGDYEVEIYPDGATEPAISAMVQLDAGKDYSAIAYGDGVNQSLGLLAIEDDNTAPTHGNFHLRLGHLAPFAAGAATADVRLEDGTVVANDVDFTDVTAFLPLPAGTYDLKITTPDGATTLINPLPATFNAGDLVTAFATGEGTNQDLGVFAWPVDVEGFFLPLGEPMSYLRVAHLAPFAEGSGTSVTVRLNGADALTDFVYGESTEYIELEPGEYLVEVLPGGGPTIAISATVDLEAYQYYSAAAIGDGVNQPLALLPLVDDNTAPADGKFHLRLGHLAPFAAGAATADIRLEDGTVIVDDVDFSDVTAYIPLDAGTYDLKITTPDGATTLINPLPVTFNEGDLVTAFATGEGMNQDLGVFAWPVDVEGFFLPLGDTEYIIYMPVIRR